MLYKSRLSLFRIQFGFWGLSNPQQGVMVPAETCNTLFCLPDELRRGPSVLICAICQYLWFFLRRASYATVSGVNPLSSFDRLSWCSSVSSKHVLVVSASNFFVIKLVLPVFCLCCCWHASYLWPWSHVHPQEFPRIERITVSLWLVCSVTHSHHRPWLT